MYHERFHQFRCQPSTCLNLFDREKGNKQSVNPYISSTCFWKCKTKFLFAITILLCPLDINECGEDTHNCDLNAYCTNLPGSFKCTCNQGYSGPGDECVKESETYIHFLAYFSEWLSIPSITVKLITPILEKSVSVQKTAGDIFWKSTWTSLRPILLWFVVVIWVENYKESYWLIRINIISCLED